MARALLALIVFIFGLCGTIAAQDLQFFRIGTGGVAGTYYPIGGLIADIISNPPGSRPCERGGSCGVSGVVAVAQSAEGSVANVEALQSGALESAFVQSDIAYWAYTATEVFAGKPKADKLRVIANLYPESMHLVVRRGAGITSVVDLAGKTVSLDEIGSGTLVEARIVLDAYGLAEDDLDVRHLDASSAIARMRAGQLDALFLVAGYPAKSIAGLAESGCCDLLSLDGDEVDRLLKRFDFLSKDTIPAGTYEGIGEIRTISVGASWLVSAAVDEDLVYGITRALWHANARRLLDDGHDKGRMITLRTALDALAVPLHPGAERYYREVGLYN